MPKACGRVRGLMKINREAAPAICEGVKHMLNVVFGGFSAIVNVPV